MFCKFCGEKIDRSSMKCSKCRHEVGLLEGGIGFWDLTEKPVAHNSVHQSKQESKQVQKTSSSKPLQKKSQSQRIIIFLLLGSIALNSAALTTTVHTKKAQDEINAKVDSLSDSLLQLPDNTEINYATSEDIEEILKLLHEITSEPTTEGIAVFQKPKNIVITGESNFAEDNSLCLFSVCAMGINLSIQWQKYQWAEDGGPGQWIDLDNEEALYSINIEHLDDGSIYSRFSVHSIHENIFGSYRVLITDANDNHEILYCYARQDTSYQE